MRVGRIDCKDRSYLVPLVQSRTISDSDLVIDLRDDIYKTADDDNLDVCNGNASLNCESSIKRVSNTFECVVRDTRDNRVPVLVNSGGEFSSERPLDQLVLEPLRYLAPDQVVDPR